MSAETLQATCISESGTGCEETPTEETMITITSFTGGLSTSLDSLRTSNRRLKSIITIQPNGVGNQLVRVQLIQTIAAAEDGVRIRPLDYNETTNPRQWEVVG